MSISVLVFPIVFQEIRRALAYSAYAYYSNPETPTKSLCKCLYRRTNGQTPDAVDAMLEIMNNMPEAEDQFNQAKEAALKKIELAELAEILTSG